MEEKELAGTAEKRAIKLGSVGTHLVERAANQVTQGQKAANARPEAKP